MWSSVSGCSAGTTATGSSMTTLQTDLAVAAGPSKVTGGVAEQGEGWG